MTKSNNETRNAYSIIANMEYKAIIKNVKKIIKARIVMRNIYQLSLR